MLNQKMFFFNSRLLTIGYLNDNNMLIRNIDEPGNLVTFESKFVISYAINVWK